MTSAQADTRPQAGPEQGVGAGAWLRRHLYIVLPCLLLGAFAAPSIPYMLPAERSYQGEDYQPLKTLRFFKTRGTAYHKYGPMTDILLGPGYAATMAYWWATGDFKNPSTDFPYGFERPLEQMGLLLLQGRALFLLLVLACGATLLWALCSVGVPRWAAALGFTMCFGTSWAVIYHAANTRPEAPQMAFSAVVLALYLRMIYLPPTWKRAAWMSAFAALAVTAKELAATIFVLPYAAYAVWLWRRGRGDGELRRRFAPIVAAALGAGLGTYALFNILYAPAAWWVRIEHWLSGSGLDHAVWLPEQPTAAEQALQIAQSLLSALGPAGSLFAAIALAALLARRPAGWLLLLLPFVSLMALGLIPLGYGGDRFYTLACLTLVPPCSFGAAELWQALRATARKVAAAGAAAALAVNLWTATLSWHALRMQPDYMIEQSLQRAEFPPGKSVYIVDVYDALPGASRLGRLGYRVEWRGLQRIADGDPATRPDRIYSAVGMLAFLDEARDMPARAATMEDAGFRAAEWRGVEAMGYRRTGTLIPRTPDWFPFDWLPSVRYIQRHHRVAIFDRVP